MMSESQTRDPSTFFIRTFGCQMNVHDSEHIAGVLEEAGYVRAATAEEAGLVIFNTCSVRESAEDRAWGNIAMLASSPGGSPRVAVCGCMAQRHGIEILQRFSNVDLVFGLASLARLPQLLERSRRSPVVDLGDIEDSWVDELPVRCGSAASAWVPVSYGCDNSCSYCVVPLVRGRQRSRALDRITEEVETLARGGVIEVTLLGQNVNSYGRDLEPQTTFAGLLARVASTPGLRRVKFETSHPSDLSDDILEAMGEDQAVCEHLHLPVQSGSDRVLERMLRGYTADFYLERVERARELVPDLAVTTDIIVGFPGESEDDFRYTLELVRRARFDSAFTFIYSPRAGTRAYGYPDDVTAEAKRERFGRLSLLQDEIGSHSLGRLEGKSVEVLVEGPARRGPFVTGRTRGNQVVLLPEDSALKDTLVMAEIVGSGKHALRGETRELLYDPGPRK